MIPRRHCVSRSIPSCATRSFLEHNSIDKFICGDFNCEIKDGHQDAPENIGTYSKGKTSHNGKYLIDFIVQNNLYVTNTFFKHKLEHITTHQSNLSLPHRKNPFRKQIDFIIANKVWKRNNIDSRSHSGTIVDSDHRLVKASFDLDYRKIYSKTAKNKNVNVSHLKNQEIADKYKALVENKVLKAHQTKMYGTTYVKCA